MSNGKTPGLARAPGMSATTQMFIVVSYVSALPQLATALYLPSLITIAKEFSASMSMVQHSLASFLATFAVAQLFYGPFSDRFGRKPTAILGLIVFVLGSVLCAIATDVQSFVIARGVEGCGAAAGSVLARAIVRDAYSGEQVVRVFAFRSAMVAIIPGVGPFLGGLLEQTVGWRYSFYLSTVAGVGALALVLYLLPETNTQRIPSIRIGAILKKYAECLSSSKFRYFGLSSAFAVAMQAILNASAPIVLMTQFGVSSFQLSIFFGVNVLSFITGNLLAERLARWVGGWRRLGYASFLLIIGGPAVMILLTVTDHLTVLSTTVTCMIYMLGMGWFLPFAAASSLTDVSKVAGTASALLGFAQFGMCAVMTVVVSQVAKLLPPELSFSLTMLVCALISLAILLVASSRKSNH
jgi:MFS transporter, DHA1 family, multidrug resistance protein